MDSLQIFIWVLSIISLILFLIPYFNKKLKPDQLQNMHIINNILFVLVMTLVYTSKR
jgi:hypothetical protein